MAKPSTMLEDGLTYITQIPQRYSVNFTRYNQRWGLVRQDDVIPFVSHGYDTDLARYYFFALTFDQILKEQVPGDLAELGVYKGNTGAILANAARRLDRTLYLLDTFEGFSDRDLTAIDADKHSQFADTSLEAVRDLVGSDHVAFVKGFFPDTATQLPEAGRYCLVHIDCDLYAPFKSALHYFWPRLSPGGFLIMHDYTSLHWNGAERAVDEFFAGKVESVVPVPDASGTVVVRKARDIGLDKSWFIKTKVDKLTRSWRDNAWIEPVKDGLTDLLDEGWAENEGWGYWGIGDQHTIRFARGGDFAGCIAVDLDIGACLMGARTATTIDIYCAGAKIAAWEFTEAANRGVRTLFLPSIAISEASDVPFTTVAFRPRSILSPKDLDLKSDDNRQLGAALFRLRTKVLSDDGWLDLTPEGSALQYLTDGWSSPENWGTWGIGDRQSFNVPVPANTYEASSMLECDIAACLIGGRKNFVAEVFIDGVKCADWSFSEQNNRGLRSAPMPASRRRSKLQDLLQVTLRSNARQSPHDLDPALQDTRNLAVALNRFRLRPKPTRSASQ